MTNMIHVEDLGEILANAMVGRLKDRGTTESEASSIHDAAIQAVNDAWPNLKWKCCEATARLTNDGCRDREVIANVIYGFFRAAGIEIADGLYDTHISHTRN